MRGSPKTLTLHPFENFAKETTTRNYGMLTLSTVSLFAFLENHQLSIPGEISNETTCQGSRLAVEQTGVAGDFAAGVLNLNTAPGGGRIVDACGEVTGHPLC